MMYMHYCKRCHRVYMLNGHKQTCPKCHEGIAELKLSYMDYVSMNREERNHFCRICSNDMELQKLSTTYRMYKYSKWYKELQKQCPSQTIITYTMPERTTMDNVASMV